MAKLIFTLFICLSFSCFSQTQIYHRVKIRASSEEIKSLSEKGLIFDHGEHHSNELITEISDFELNILKQSKVPFEILISDMTQYYQQRNKVSKQASTSSVACVPDIKTPNHFHLGSYAGFFTLSEMELMLDSMKILFPNLITVKQAISPIQTIEGRTIYYVKISDNPNVNEGEPEMFYNSVHHAREPASMSQLIYYMWYLLENYQTNSDVKALVDNTELYFVPCVNPDGYVYNETTNPGGGGMWRKNRRDNGDGTFGVDLNRNYGEQWGYDNSGSSPMSYDETYRGLSPFSEPETQAMRDFCINNNFKFCLSNHTYGNVLIYPWNYIPDFYTPDSAIFVNWAELLTKDDLFSYGTTNQTLGYLVNGGVDDWMYGEQSIKPKLLSMTPESGTYIDGFWPQQNRIIDICKSTISQNLNSAWLITNYALLDELNDQFISQTTGYFKYDLKRMGLENGTFTVSVSPYGSSVSSVGPPKVYSTLGILQSQTDSISFNLSSGLAAGTPIKYIYELDNGFYTFRDTITKIYGPPVVVFKDSCDNLNKWTAPDWGTTTEAFVSANSSITDSPFTYYLSGLDTYATITSTLNLTDAIYAHLQFYTKYSLEKDNDWVQLQISTDGFASYIPLCGKYSITVVVLNEPVYSNRTREWVKEEIDLSGYAGQSVSLRFNFRSGPWGGNDGFYFDDVLLRKIVGTPASVKELGIIDFSVYPNPASSYITIEGFTNFIDYKIVNQLGQIIKYDKLKEARVPVSGIETGMYYLQLTDKNGTNVTKKVFISRW